MADHDPDLGLAAGPEGDEEIVDPDAAAAIATPHTAVSGKSPWDTGCFRADLDALAGVLTQVLPSATGTWPGPQGGALGKALDRWVADELYRAGYEADSVWPRKELPAYLPVPLVKAINRLSKTRQGDPLVAALIKAGRSTLGRRPALIGEFYVKQFDVLVADWDRGVELMVSTKGMTSSFSNNLINRWEEFVGEVRNVRGRYPIATLGSFFLADSKVVDDPVFPKVIDMLRKLRSPEEARGAFDATGLVLARAEGGTVTLDMDKVPNDLHPDCFFWRLLLSVFERMPVSERVPARTLYEESVPYAAAGTSTRRMSAEETPCGCAGT